MFRWRSLHSFTCCFPWPIIGITVVIILWALILSAQKSNSKSKSILRVLHGSSHSNGRFCYYPHFTDQKAETQGMWVGNSRFHSVKWESRAWTQQSERKSLISTFQYPARSGGFSLHPVLLFLSVYYPALYLFPCLPLSLILSSLREWTTSMSIYRR